MGLMLSEWEHDYDEAREEARAEARREDADERTVACADCGERWDPGRHRATRTDPAYEDRPECPACGGSEREGD